MVLCQAHTSKFFKEPAVSDTIKSFTNNLQEMRTMEFSRKQANQRRDSYFETQRYDCRNEYLTFFYYIFILFQKRIIFEALIGFIEKTLITR